MNDREKKPDLFDELSLAPDWAREPSDQQSHEKFFEEHHFKDGGGYDYGGRSGGRDRGGQRWEKRRRRDDTGTGTGTGTGRRPRQRAPHGDSRVERSPAPRVERRWAPDTSQGETDRRRTYPRQASQPPAESPVEVRFLPEPKSLSVILAKVTRGHRAFPLRDLARLFLDHPGSCEVRIEKKRGEGDITFYQCTRCGYVSLHEAELLEHARETHFAEYFSKEEIAGDPPSGEFPFVTRCGITGKWLGPPNHHSYNQNIQEMLRGECSNIPEEEYRSRIETLRDPESVEQWRQQAARRVVYRRTGGEEPGEELDRIMMERTFATEIFPELVSTPRHAVCNCTVAMGLRDRTLSGAIQYAWSREQRYPASLFFALRGVFRHKRFYLFRAGEGRGLDFVMSRKPTPLDVQHAVPELKEIFDYLLTNPGATRTELLQALSADAGEVEEKHKQLLAQLNWITERGHLIEYSNGVLALPEERPFFRNVQRQHRRTREE